MHHGADLREGGRPTRTKEPGAHPSGLGPWPREGTRSMESLHHTGWGHHGCVSDTQASGSRKEKHWNPKKMVHLEKRTPGPSSYLGTQNHFIPSDLARLPVPGCRHQEGNRCLWGNPLPRPVCNFTGWKES